MIPLNIQIIPQLKDNYSYLLSNPDKTFLAIVDPSEAGPVLAAFGSPKNDLVTSHLDPSHKNVKLNLILNTHHHHDHVGGNDELQRVTGAPIWGPDHDQHRLKMDRGLKENEVIEIGPWSARVLFIPGHTNGHIALHFFDHNVVFVGDTLFSLGCGRLFEGTFGEMWDSLNRLMNLPDETLIYPGHEYTVANCNFALSLKPQDPFLGKLKSALEKKRASGEPTIPSTLAFEKQFNPFLACGSETWVKSWAIPEAAGVSAFRWLRQKKDKF